LEPAVPAWLAVTPAAVAVGVGWAEAVAGSGVAVGAVATAAEAGVAGDVAVGSFGKEGVAVDSSITGCGVKAIGKEVGARLGMPASLAFLGRFRKSMADKITMIIAKTATKPQPTT
jgi:uncharacterized membrane protein YphA (DoxX/SURF4 family)